MSTENILVSFGVGCIPVVLNLCYLRWVEKKRVAGEKKYLLIRIANIFEHFSLHCLEAYSLVGAFRAQVNNDEVVSPVVIPVLLADYPTDLNWQSISPDLANEIIGFKNYLVESEWDFACAEENCNLPYERDYEKQATAYMRGHKAWLLAKKLRNESGTVSSLDCELDIDWSRFEGQEKERKRIKADVAKNLAESMMNMKHTL